MTRRTRAPAPGAGPRCAGRNHKREGELAEVEFLKRALKLGLVVSKPYGDSAPYDFVVGDRQKLSRVQVKSTARRERGAYHVSSGSGGMRKWSYTREEIDVLAVYIVPLDTWYLIPIEAFTPVRTMWLRPGSGRRFESFREGWDLLQERI
jgi:hypothetical protein